VSLSALSIPLATDRLAKIVEEQWGELKGVQSQEELQFFRKMLQKFPSLVSLFSDFKDSEIWEAIEGKRSGAEQEDGAVPDIKLPE
jgi:Globin